MLSLLVDFIVQVHVSSLPGGWDSWLDVSSLFMHSVLFKKKESGVTGLFDCNCLANTMEYQLC